MADQEEIMFMLGQIKGQLDGVSQQLITQGTKIDGMDKRLRSVEVKAARHGLIAGGVGGLGITIIAASVKAAFKTNGV